MCRPTAEFGTLRARHHEPGDRSRGYRGDLRVDNVARPVAQSHRNRRSRLGAIGRLTGLRRLVFGEGQYNGLPLYMRAGEIGGGANLPGAQAITDAGLAHLAGLTMIERLELPGTVITGKSLAAFGPHPKLKTLSLAFSSFDDDGCRFLSEAFPGWSRFVSITPRSRTWASSRSPAFQTAPPRHQLQPASLTSVWRIFSGHKDLRSIAGRGHAHQPASSRQNARGNRHVFSPSALIGGQPDG